MPNPFRVGPDFGIGYPGLSLRSNPGLTLANAFGVNRAEITNAFGVNQKLNLIEACITRGVRAAITAPNRAFVCWKLVVQTFDNEHAAFGLAVLGLLTTNPHTGVASMSRKFEWLKML